MELHNGCVLSSTVCFLVGRSSFRVLRFTFPRPLVPNSQTCWFCPSGQAEGTLPGTLCTVLVHYRWKFKDYKDQTRGGGSMGPRACPRAGLGLLPVVILAALLAAGAAASFAPRAECSAGSGYESDEAGAECKKCRKGRWYKPQDMPQDKGRLDPGCKMFHQKMGTRLVPSRRSSLLLRCRVVMTVIQTGMH